ncbi:hypothetical protein ACTFIW_000816 [Dictyostelium discoideum]
MFMLVKFGKQERPCKIVADKKQYPKHLQDLSQNPLSVPHEFMAVEGIAEDVTNIVLNVKGILLRALPSEESSVIREARFVTSELEVSQEDLDMAGGQVLVTPCQVFASSPFEVVNPDHHLFTITKPMSRQIDFRVVGEIDVDTAFSLVVLAIESILALERQFVDRTESSISSIRKHSLSKSPSSSSPESLDALASTTGENAAVKSTNTAFDRELYF